MKFLDSLLSGWRHLAKPLRRIVGPSPQDTLAFRYSSQSRASAERFEDFLKRLPVHRSSGFTTNNTTWTQSLNWTSSLSQTGGPYPPLASSATITASYTVGTQAANAAVGGGDLFFSFQQGITAGSTYTLNLASMTDIMQRGSIVPVRLKQMRIRLLSAANDGTINPAPTATSTMTITNIGPVTPSPFTFNNGGSGATVTLSTSTGAVTGVAVGAGGTLYAPSGSFFLASPIQAGGSGNVFLCTTTTGGAVGTTTFISGTGGSGYSNGTVPLIPVGQQLLTTGASQMYGDITAAGWLLPTSTQKNVYLTNNDSVNAITAEISFAGGSS
jgi:hypothetical protein